MTHERLDIIQLIENNPIEKLSNHYQTQLLDKIKETFSDSDQCAKVYNEQALYFNNHFETNYKLNVINDFITIEKNHINELEKLKKKKYSRFTGVTIRNDNGKFRAYIKHNGKVIHCGTFKDELDAAKAYNLKAEELNKLESTQTKYELNNFEL